MRRYAFPWNYYFSILKSLAFLPNTLLTINFLQTSCVFRNFIPIPRLLSTASSKDKGLLQHTKWISRTHKLAFTMFLTMFFTMWVWSSRPLCSWPIIKTNNHLISDICLYYTLLIHPIQSLNESSQLLSHQIIQQFTISQSQRNRVWCFSFYFYL